MSKSPVYNIRRFRETTEDPQFYANVLPAHLKTHTFVNLPHKHDFYMVVLITKGEGAHEIDFKKYPVKPGTLFLMQPGQMHHWTFSKDIDGIVFFHSRAFYEGQGRNLNLQDYEFYQSMQNKPVVVLKPQDAERIRENMRSLVTIARGDDPLREAKLWAYLHLTYLEIASVYKSGQIIANTGYLATLREFERLVEQNYRNLSAPSEYAELLGISPRHLNRICRECLGKTSIEVIADRFILEAKRLLLTDEITVSEVSYDLNFSDISYFTRFFKKYTGTSPSHFIKKYRNR